MSTTITILYPQVSDSTFDLDYYLKSHMPMVEEKFGAHGLTGWRVSRLLGTASGEAAPYSVQCILEFPSKDAFDAAIKNEAGPVLGDIPNFSNKEPVLMIGEAVGSSSKP